MLNDYQTNKPEKYEFTVKRISLLQKLLSSADKKTVNQFIDEVRRTVYFYHVHQHEIVSETLTQETDEFFKKLNNKAHQLARFTTELSSMMRDAPPELYMEALKADRSIDGIHGELVNLCLTLDELLKQKGKFVIDITTTVKTIYDCYCRVFKVKPSGVPYTHGSDIPDQAPLEDMLVPVLHILVMKDLDRCHRLAQKVIRNSTQRPTNIPDPQKN
jgi:hypothetical protein